MRKWKAGSYSGQVGFHEHRLRGFVSLDDPLESMAVNAKPSEVPVKAEAWKDFGSVEASSMAAQIRRADR